jgi:hypothetical protein
VSDNDLKTLLARAYDEPELEARLRERSADPAASGSGSSGNQAARSNTPLAQSDR